MGSLKNKTPSSFLPLGDQDEELLAPRWASHNCLFICSGPHINRDVLGEPEDGRGRDWKWERKAGVPCSSAPRGPSRSRGWRLWRRAVLSPQGHAGVVLTAPHASQPGRLLGKQTWADQNYEGNHMYIYIYFLLPTSWETRCLMANGVACLYFAPWFFGRI